MPVTAIVVVLTLIAVIGGAALLVTSARLRDEIEALLRAFGRAEHTLTPVVVEVRAGRVAGVAEIR